MYLTHICPAGSWGPEKGFAETENFRYCFVVLFFTFCEGSCMCLSQLFWLRTRGFKMIPNNRQVALDLPFQFPIYDISGSLRQGHVSLTHFSFSFEKGSYSTLSLCSPLFWIYHVISSVLSDKHLARWPSISNCDSVSLKRIRHIGQLSRVEDPSLCCTGFSLQLSFPAMLIRGGFLSAGMLLVSPNEILLWCICVWSSLFSCFFFSLLFCTVPLQCCWILRAFTVLCDNVRWHVEVLCWVSLNGLRSTSALEIPPVSSPAMFLGSVLLCVCSDVEGKLFSSSAWSHSSCKCSICVPISWGEQKSSGLKFCSFWKAGNDVQWKSFIPILKTSCFCRFSSSQLFLKNSGKLGTVCQLVHCKSWLMFLSSKLHVFSHSFKSFFSNHKLLSVDALKREGVLVVQGGERKKKMIYIAIILPLNSSSWGILKHLCS